MQKLSVLSVVHMIAHNNGSQKKLVPSSKLNLTTMYKDEHCISIHSYVKQNTTDCVTRGDAKVVIWSILRNIRIHFPAWGQEKRIFSF